MPEKICILFNKVPEGTLFLTGHYSWVLKDRGLEFIKNGYGVEYDPVKKEVVKTKEQPALTDFPKDMPGRSQLIKAGICFMELVNEMDEFRNIPGIGEAKEKEILEYLNERA